MHPQGQEGSPKGPGALARDRLPWSVTMAAERQEAFMTILKVLPLAPGHTANWILKSKFPLVTSGEGPAGEKIRDRSKGPADRQPCLFPL